MKNRIVNIIAYILFFSIYCNAQDYQTILTGSDFYFRAVESFSVPVAFEYPSPKHNYVRCIGIDSTSEIDTDLILYNFNVIQNTDTTSVDPIEGCFIPYGVSWTGKKILIKDNGSNVFFNLSGDSVKINTIASLSDSWKFYRFPNNDYIEATVIGHDPASFLDITDSVKTIELMAKNVSGQDIGHPVNNTVINISKNYGFIHTLNFRDFPDLIEEYELVGKSNPDAGVKPSTIGDIFDFDIGDEFHYNVEKNWPNFPYYKRIRIILNKYFSPLNDTVYYDIQDTEWYIYYIDTFITSYDTTFLYTNLDSSIFIKHTFNINKLPFETISNEYFYSIGNYTMFSDTNYNFRLTMQILKEKYSNPGYPYDSCYTVDIPYKNIIKDWYDWGYFNNYKRYIEGCGELINYWQDYGIDHPDPHCNPCEELVYFKKGSEEWGTPLIIPVQINENTLSRFEIQIIPNPNPGKFLVQIPEIKEGSSLRIYDIFGREIYTQKDIVTKNFQIDISTQPQGLYFIEISGKNIMVKEKVMVL